MKKTFFIFIFLISCTLNLRAQFSLSGNEAPSVQWESFQSPNYEFIYPRGNYELALKYALEWERYRQSVGIEIDQKIPVLLHSYSATSNGFVAWTPFRMEMYTNPSMYRPEPIEWHTLLAIHESRHVAQANPLFKKPWRGFHYAFGDLLSGGILSLISTSMYMEGDAVNTETLLSGAGRGRSADFLEYYRTCFEEGDLRDFYRWRYGSSRLYTPDYYKIGYISVKGLGIGPTDEYTDFKLRARFDSLAVKMAEDWQEKSKKRGPFQPYVQLTKNRDFYTSYSGLCVQGSMLYATRSAMDRNTHLVSIHGETGEVVELANSAAPSSRLLSVGQRLYWTEELPDLRFEMHSSSALRYFDGKNMRTAIGEKRLYNPAVGVEKTMMAVVENMVDGRCAINCYKVEDGVVQGELIERYIAPYGIQFLEPVFIDGQLYASVQSANGQGIYKIAKGEGLQKEGAEVSQEAKCQVLIAECKVKINQLFSYNNLLYFTSDINEVNELYSIDPNSLAILKWTNLPQGGRDFVFLNDKIYFTYLSSRGRNICYTHISELQPIEVSFSICSNLFSESNKKDTIAASKSIASEEKAEGLYEAKPYSKWQLPRVHSWVPLYLDVDDFASASFETIYTKAGLGATMYFQNAIGTISGDLAYKAWNQASGWQPYVELNATYRGHAPVIETKLRLATRGYYGRVRAYTPINLSRNGWRSAVVPNLQLEFNSQTSIFSGGIRAYSMLPVCASAIYPRLGVGAELGFISMARAENRVSPYALLYGYLPGFKSTHSWALRASLNTYSGTHSFSASYAFPFLYLDSSALSPLCYVKNFELIPRYELYTDLASGVKAEHRFGGQFNILLGNILFVTYDIRLGVSCSYGGQLGWMYNFVCSYDL